jgi:signal transduction histidine kinase
MFNERLKQEIETATAELREKNIELQKLDELKSDFVSNVSHELRTPLTSISGYTKLLMMEKLGKLNPRQTQSLSIVSDESDRLTRLINDVLDLSKLEAGKIEVRPERFDIAELAKETMESLGFEAEKKNIKLDLNVKTRNTMIEAGRDLIKQVFINLINNALKFTHSNGKVSITIRRVNKILLVDVLDTGKGIAKEDIPKLFNKFVQVDSSMTREEGGTGLGLVIVKHILSLHNGKIDVKSEVGRGSRFTFRVPAEMRIKEEEAGQQLAVEG